MKKIAVLLLLLFVASNASADVFEADGHYWMGLSRSEKIRVVQGIMIGLSASIEILNEEGAPRGVLMMFVFPYESEWNVGSIINWIDWTYTESSASMSFPLRHTVKMLLEVSQGR